MQLISLQIVPLFYEVTERVRLDHPYSKNIAWLTIAQAADNPEDENEGRQPRSWCTSMDVKNSARVDRSKWNGLFLWRSRRRGYYSSLYRINEEIPVCDRVFKSRTCLNSSTVYSLVGLSDFLPLSLSFLWLGNSTFLVWSVLSSRGFLGKGFKRSRRSLMSCIIHPSISFKWRRRLWTIPVRMLPRNCWKGRISSPFSVSLFHFDYLWFPDHPTKWKQILW